MVGVYDIKHWCSTLSNECIRFQPANNTHKFLGVKSFVSSRMFSKSASWRRIPNHHLSVCDGDTNSEQ